MFKRPRILALFFLVGLICAVLGFSILSSSERSASSPKEAFKQLCASWAERDLEGFLSLFHGQSRLKRLLSENPTANPWDLWDDENSSLEQLFRGTIISESGIGQATASLLLQIEIPAEPGPTPAKINMIFSRSHGRYLLIDIIL